MSDAPGTELRIIAVARRSDVGRRRSHNEDRDLVAPPILAVADGLGGQQAGEIAAAAAIAAVAKVSASPSPASLRAAVEEANRSVRRLAARDPARAGMGTTLTAALLMEGKIGLVHVGDSRAYRLRGGVLERLTEDHSVVAEMARRGEITATDAERHPNRNVITRAVGADPVIRADIFEIEAEAGDVLMLCTDGLCGAVRDERMLEILLRDDDLDRSAAELTAAANDAGGPDNITVVLGRIGLGQEAAAEMAEQTRGGDTAPQPAIPRPSPVTLIGSAPPAPRRRDEPPSPRTVLQRVPERTDRARGRSRKAPAAICVVVLILVGGATAWVGDRSYFLDREGDGQVSLYHGLPFSIGPLDTFGRSEPLGIPFSVLSTADRAAVSGAIQGQGEATLAAVRLLWHSGVPELS